MRLLSRVCAEFHDPSGAVLFTVHPAVRGVFLDAPDSIRQDPLFGMMLSDGSLELPTISARVKQLENDPMKEPEKAKPVRSAASAGDRTPGGKGAAEKV